MTTHATPTPEDRLTAVAGAIAAAERAEAALQAAIAITDSLARLDASLALLMVSGTLTHACADLRRCHAALCAGGGQ